MPRSSIPTQDGPASVFSVPILSKSLNSWRVAARVAGSALVLILLTIVMGRELQACKNLVCSSLQRGPLPRSHRALPRHGAGPQYCWLCHLYCTFFLRIVTSRPPASILIPIFVLVRITIITRKDILIFIIGTLELVFSVFHVDILVLVSMSYATFRSAALARVVDWRVWEESDGEVLVLWEGRVAEDSSRGWEGW